MSNKYIDEIRKLPENCISVIEAHIQVCGTNTEDDLRTGC